MNESTATESTGIHLISLEAENVKRIKAVNITFPPTGVFAIGGNNAQGKTSCISAIMYALGGEKYRPSSLQRDGAETLSHIKVNLSNGIIVERVGDQKVKITDSNGTRQGQKLLNDFISEFAIDLPKFLNASSKEKANTLLQIIGVGPQLEKLDAEENAYYEERHTVGQIALQKEKAAKEMPYWPDVGEVELSVSELSARLQEAIAENAKKMESRNRLAENRSRIDSLNASLREVENATIFAKENALSAYQTAVSRANDLHDEEIRLAKERYEQAVQAADARHMASLNSAQEQKNNALESAESTRNASSEAIQSDIERCMGQIAEDEAVDTVLIDTNELTQKISSCEADNAKIRENISRAKVIKEGNDLRNTYNELDAKIEDVRRRRQELLDGANLPLKGLSVQNGTLYLNGKAWDCMSGSEQLTAAIAIASALKPECSIMLVDKLEQFDKTQIGVLDDYCKTRQIQLIGTRVANDDTCSIIIEDGEVVK